MSEEDIVEQIRVETGTGEARNPISFLVEAADDIVNLAADVEDAVKKSVLSWKKVKKQLEEGGEAAREALDYQKKILRAGRASVPGDLDDDIWASAFRTAAIKVMVEGAFQVFKDQYGEIMEGRYPGSLLCKSNAKELAKCLKKIRKEKVYRTPSTLKLELMGRRVIGDLMDVFWEGAVEMPLEDLPNTSDFSGKAAALFSPNYRKVFQDSVKSNRSQLPEEYHRFQYFRKVFQDYVKPNKSKLPEEYHRFQLVTDQISGMTDSFAKRLHGELFNGG